MTSATRHRRLLLALASAMLATTIYGGLPIERPKRKLRMVDAAPAPEQVQPVVDSRQA